MADDPRRIEDVIRSLLRSWGLDRFSREQRVFVVWEEALGELAHHSRPAAVHDGQLVIAVKDNVWMTELQFRKEEIKKKLNRALGGAVIREVRFKIGSWEETDAEGEDAEEDAFDPAILAEVEAVLAPVKDRQLRERLRNLLLRSARGRSGGDQGSVE